MKKSLFEVKEVDRAFYEERIRDFLPSKIIDIHTHLWLSEFKGKRQAPLRHVTWPQLVAAQNPIEDLIETYDLMFPGKEVKALVFGTSSSRENLGRANEYVSRASAAHGFPALIYARPEWSDKELDEKITAGGFLGVKVYLSLSKHYIPESEIRIFDFLPRHQLELLNQRGLIVMLHIPRHGRLKDQVNLQQMLEIEKDFQRLHLIIAHIGRAYCPEDLGDAFEVLAPAKQMRFDISANTNETVFRAAIRAVGPERLLFGSDLPITRMRMRRICEAGRYVNIVPRGLYGDISGDKNMREADEEEAKKLSFFLYEEIDAFLRAARAEGLSSSDIEAVFHDNAVRMLEAAADKPRAQLEMTWPDSVPLPAPAVHGPYVLRTFRPGDEEAYKNLMARAGFTNWGDESLRECLMKALPRGIYFAAHKDTGALAATACARHSASERHAFGGELGWVAADPDHRGQGLGAAVSAAALKRLVDAGYTEIFLLTDDFRLAAIKIYLKQGWKPSEFSSEMKKRWRAVCLEIEKKAEDEALS